MNTIVHWHAVYTRPRSEKKVIALLQKKGIVHYCPQLHARKAGNATEKSVSALFPAIIFVQATEHLNILSLAQLPYVINVLYWKEQPAIFPAGEIDLLRDFLAVHDTVAIMKTGLHNNNSTNPAADNICAITLPSMGYTLTAVTAPAANAQPVKNSSSRYNGLGALTFILGFKIARR